MSTEQQKEQNSIAHNTLDAFLQNLQTGETKEIDTFSTFGFTNPQQFKDTFFNPEKHEARSEYFKVENNGNPCNWKITRLKEDDNVPPKVDLHYIAQQVSKYSESEGISKQETLDKVKEYFDERS
jgi:hypothetical protein